MKIEIQDYFDLLGYVVGSDNASEIKKHFNKYGDFGRIKHLATISVIARNREHHNLQITNKKLHKELDRLRQLSITSYNHRPDKE